MDDNKNDQDQDQGQDEDDEVVAVVVDNGTCHIKSGLSNEEQPRSQVDTVIGRPRITTLTDQVYMGYEALSKSGLKASIYRPISHGVIKNWDDMELMWQYIFSKELKIDIEDQYLFMTEAPTNPRQAREKMTQIAFESFNVSGFYTNMCAVLAMYGIGKTTGISIGAGADLSYTVPVYEGYSLAHGIQHLPIGGMTVDDYLAKLFQQKGYEINTRELAIAESIVNIKEKLCYVSLDYKKDTEIAQSDNQERLNYTMPDGNKIVIASERFQCPEIFFQPKLVLNSRVPNLAQCATKSVLSCNVDIRKTLYQNVLISGGSTMFKGFCKRLENEVKQKVPSSMPVSVITPANRRQSVYTGGCVVASLSVFNNQWIVQKEYDEYGPKIVHRKCF